VVDVLGANQWQQGGFANAFAVLGDGEWHHIAWEWDTQAEEPFATLYVDGVAENFNVIGEVSFDGGILGAEMEIGSRQGGFDAFQGYIDDFRIFDSAIYGRQSFTPPTQSTIPDSPVGIAGDFDGDGNLDVAAANESGNNVTILLGNGDGTFAPHVDYPTGAAFPATAMTEAQEFSDIYSLAVVEIPTNVAVARLDARRRPTRPCPGADRHR
jgi:hypothetical protein